MTQIENKYQDRYITQKQKARVFRSTLHVIRHKSKRQTILALISNDEANRRYAEAKAINIKHGIKPKGLTDKQIQLRMAQKQHTKHKVKVTLPKFNLPD